MLRKQRYNASESSRCLKLYQKGVQKGVWDLRGQRGGAKLANRSRENMAHIRQSRPDFGLGFKVKVPGCSLYARKRTDRDERAHLHLRGQHVRPSTLRSGLGVIVWDMGFGVRVRWPYQSDTYFCRILTKNLIEKECQFKTLMQ